MFKFLENPHYDFLAKARLAIALSLVLILAGLGYLATQGVRSGVEFSGGTQLILKFEQTPQLDKIRAAVEKVAPGAVIQTYDEPAKNQVLVRVAAVEGHEEALDAVANRLRQAIESSYPGNPLRESSTEIVGPVVGAELRQKAVWLTVLGLFAQLLYIGFRFNGAVWGSAAAIASLHDVLVTLALLAFFRFELTLNVIAALLTLVGYSVNDTIVIFDRARENLHLRRKDSLAHILNDSINQTLTRTIYSNGTTFLSVLALLLWGGEVLRGFAFTMVVGVLVGTYSTIFIASPIVVWWREGRGAKTAAKAA
jgi:preprotein translocase subunit SecF